MTDPPAEMPISPARASSLSQNLAHVLSSIKSSLPPPRTTPPRLVLVSKLKPANDILHLHSPSSSNSESNAKPHPAQSHFGENYYQELLEKSRILPRTIRWHFIGALQSNKCKPMAEEIPNLWAVESVDSIKKASGLEKGRSALLKKVGSGETPLKEPDDLVDSLNVFVQVNTSGEAEKSGAEPGDAALEICKHIRDSCPHLYLKGVMTIGAIARSQAAKEGEENEDFVALRRVRDELAEALGVEQGTLELSMGMSQDYESAIRCGSDEVRVGSTVFGERPSKQDAKIKEDVEEEKG
ncbi:MAG: hypothetical protein Q9174_003869 [Haloplaca sp. 1 TL-2023]